MLVKDATHRSHSEKVARRRKNREARLLKLFYKKKNAKTHISFHGGPTFPSWEILDVDVQKINECVTHVVERPWKMNKEWRTQALFCSSVVHISEIEPKISRMQTQISNGLAKGDIPGTGWVAGLGYAYVSLLNSILSFDYVVVLLTHKCISLDV